MRTVDSDTSAGEVDESRLLRVVVGDRLETRKDKGVYGRQRCSVGVNSEILTIADNDTDALTNSIDSDLKSEIVRDHNHWLSFLRVCLRIPEQKANIVPAPVC